MEEGEKFMDFICPGYQRFTTILHTKPKVDMPEHFSDEVYLDGDLSLEEHLLAARYPADYDLYVNGIRRIPVWDDGAKEIL